MNSGKILLTSVLLFAFIAAGLGTAQSATFGISAGKTKIGDAGGTGGVYVSKAGNHGMVVYDNTVYAAYTAINYVTNETEVHVGKSYDGGLTWSDSELVAHGPDIDGNGAVVAVGIYQGTKYVHVAWGVDLAPNGNGAIYYSRAADTGSDGWSWSTPVMAINSIGSSGLNDVLAASRNIAADDSGRVHITASSWDDLNYSAAILYAGSTDAGQTFTQETAVPGVSAAPSLAATAAGDAFISWWGDNSRVYFSKRVNSGWTTPVVASGVYGGAPTSIAAMDSNHIYIAWGGTAPFQGTGPIYIASTSDGGNTWTQQQIYAGSPIHVGSMFQGILSLGVSATGVQTVVFEGNEVLNTPASVYYMRGLKSGWSAPAQIITDGRSPAVAINSAGKALVMSPENNSHAVYFTKEQ